jgi:hypothetical protein
MDSIKTLNPNGTGFMNLLKKNKNPFIHEDERASLFVVPPQFAGGYLPGALSILAGWFIIPTDQEFAITGSPVPFYLPFGVLRQLILGDLQRRVLERAFSPWPSFSA